MKENYSKVKEFWDDVFDSSPVKLDFVSKDLPFEGIEASIRWVSYKRSYTLDFGCGNGTLLLRSIFLSGAQGLGIDISPKGIKRANEGTSQLNLSKQVEFRTASIEYLSSLDDMVFDSVILSNVLDNLLPSDGLLLLDTIKRKMKKGGRLYLKLNDYRDKKQMIDDGAVEIDNNVFKESEGIYLWNLDDKNIRSLVEGEFQIEEEKRVELMGGINRAFHLLKR